MEALLSVTSIDVSAFVSFMSPFINSNFFFYPQNKILKCLLSKNFWNIIELKLHSQVNKVFHESYLRQEVKQALESNQRNNEEKSMGFPMKMLSDSPLALSSPQVILLR
ncbi:CLUMA_CG005031, isoform A [Clunio marinus]|uniref:CLUMA_CG005031, isoform A n=1 Tax=Clunio marinus TaxID=568069 RepID=A0A1J1HXV8_9DIPT|nr:CLUMA_CG005031, isoform A [Clunio marinus]